MLRTTGLVLALGLAAGAAAAQDDQARMILDMTRDNWVAVRDWDGQDLLYFTHLESYRCNIAAVDIAVNGQKATRWGLAPCDTPGALFAPLPSEHLPYASYPQGSIAHVVVRLTWPDGTAAWAAFSRDQIEMP
ncbi:MAG: hypothetical protein ACE368_11165 [Paracoccaceae bacterium]